MRNNVTDGRYGVVDSISSDSFVSNRVAVVL